MKLIDNLPEVFEEFGEKRKNAFLEIKSYKEKGTPVIGMYCAYFPMELAMAIGAIPVGLCSFSNETVPSAEKVLPKTMCPLVKSSYGFALEDKCPLFYFSDLIIGETTCDGKKKMYELMSEIKPVHVMNLPNSQNQISREYWRKEVQRVREALEDRFNIVITDEMLSQAIHLGNEIRSSLYQLCEVMKLDPAPCLGGDILKIVSGSKYRFDYRTTPELVDRIRQTILHDYQNGKMLESRPRILLTGCPTGGDDLKVIQAIEENGGLVVAVENCSGIKTLARNIDENEPDMIKAIADRYISTGCSIMTPNDNRLELIGQIVEEFHVDGVVDMILRGCHATGAESPLINRFLKEQYDIPYMSVETDYSTQDKGQISTRMTAFLEMIMDKKSGNSRVDIDRCYEILFSENQQGQDFDDRLEKLYEYTGIPIAVTDKWGEYLAGKSLMEKFSPDNPFSPENPNSDGRFLTYNESRRCSCRAILKNPCLYEKALEIMEIAARAYALFVLDTQPAPAPVPNAGKDFRWLILGKGYDKRKFEADLRKYFYSIVCVKTCKDSDYVLISDWLEEDNHEGLMTTLKNIAEEGPMKIAAGNIFTDEGSRDNNLKIVKHLYKIIGEKKCRPGVYLVEENYYELALDYIVSSTDKKQFRFEDLEIIKDADAKKEGKLYDTLYQFLLCNRKSVDTAIALGIHRNTLMYRIGRINELIGLDRKDHAYCERLLLAMELDKKKQREIKRHLKLCKPFLRN